MNILTGLSFLGTVISGITSGNTPKNDNIDVKETIEESIDDVAIQFLKNQYEVRNVEYTNLNVVLNSTLYNDLEDKVGDVVVLKRDNFYDYVIFNAITNNIDEFSLDCSDATEKFSSKIYYTGTLDFYKKKDNAFININDNEKLNKSTFNKRFNSVKKQWKDNNYFTNDNNPDIPNSKTGYNGFYDWKKINSISGYYNDDWGYVDGVGCTGVSKGLSFYSQNTFNSYFGTDNSCGPTALTNLFTYYNWQGITNKNGVVNCLKNGSAYDTFDRFRTLVNHSNTDGTDRSQYNGALKTYAKEQGYKYDLDRFIDTYEEFKENIDLGLPVHTSINLDGWGGHAILVVGYESFCQQYTENHSFLWMNWTTTEYRYARYLRVIDGWSTSNSSRFIDVTGYWDTITGRSLKIYG